MSETNEFEDIKKSLSQIVTSLSDYLSKKNTSLVQPEPVRIKKTADMTYHQFLEKALSTKKPVQVVAKKQSYRLQEDLELLLELSAYSAITSKCFEEIVAKKRLQRSFDSIRSRYNDYLSKIGQSEMKKIVSWIQRQGVEGYLSFEESQIKISINDPKDEKKVEEKKVEEKKQDKKRQRAPSLEVAEKKTEKKKETKKGIPTNCKELNDILKLYSKMVNLPIKTLLQRLDQVSGDFIQLDNYIETKDSKILWSSEEDEILRKGGAEVDLLRKYRGATVETRKKYLGIS